jgi:hypothetical protein
VVCNHLVEAFAIDTDQLHLAMFNSGRIGIDPAAVLIMAFDWLASSQ